MIKCPNCGAEIEFDPSLQEVKCSYCGETFKVDELKKSSLSEVEVAKKESDTYTGETYKCNQCGATLMTFDETAITFCSYCGSQAIIKEKMVEHNNPDFVIPFTKTKEECINSYKKKIDSFIFAPDYLKQDMQVEKFRGIYMPYGVYSLHKKGVINNEGERYRGRVGDYKYYNKYNISTDVDVSYEGLSFDLVSKFYDNFSTAIPFDYSAAEPFNVHYLHGYYADSFDVDKVMYNSAAKRVVMPNVVARLRNDKVLRHYGVISPDVDFEYESRIGMFPVYFLATRDKKNENVHYAAVNGQTGKVACDLPIDFIKYFMVSVAFAIIIFLIINNFLVLTPTELAIFAIVVGIINMIISKRQVKKIDERASHSSDLGFLSIIEEPTVDSNSDNYSEGKAKTKKTNSFKYLYKELIGIILAIIVIFSELPNDEYYYGAVFISLLLVVWSFSDLVKEHNLLTSNKLPQLNERGGNK